MKLIYFLIACALLFPGRVWSANITAIANGNWSSNSTWSCNCQPTNSDNITIPAGRTVTSSGPVILFLGPVISITIGGTLVLNNGSLQIDASDVVNILSGGKISGTGILGGAVYSGVSPIFISNGSAIDGPKTITNGVLPIELIYFRGASVKDGILLEWASASEKDFDYYEISRSIDGRSFKPIVKIPGESENGADYDFIDTAPFESINYYKLTAVDLDGSREEMQVIKEEWSGRREWITVYPNPVSDGVIHTLIFGGGSGSLRLLDCNGLVVSESLLKNEFSSFLQLPSTATPGVYFLLAEVEGKVARIKVIVRW